MVAPALRRGLRLSRYHFHSQGLEVAEATIKRFVERASFSSNSKECQQGSSQLGRRWQTWAWVACRRRTIYVSAATSTH